MKLFTQKEFIRKVGFSKSTVINYTKALEKQGYTFQLNNGQRRYTQTEIDLYIKIFNHLDEQVGSSLDNVVRSLHPSPDEKFNPPNTEILQIDFRDTAIDLTESDDYVPPTEPPHYYPYEQLSVDYEFIAEVQRSFKEVQGDIADVKEENNRLNHKIDRMSNANARRSLQTSKIARDIYNVKQELKQAQEEIAATKKRKSWIRKLLDLFRRNKDDRKSYSNSTRARKRVP